MPLSRVSVNKRGSFPESGPYIIAANHSSHVDTVILLKAMGKRNRKRLRIAASRKYFFQSKNPLHRLACTLFNLIPASGHDLIHAVHELESNNEILLIYPEGTRSRTGEIARFNIGIGKMHKESEIPIIPVAIRGTNEIMPAGSFWAKKGCIDLIVGEPMVMQNVTAEVITLVVEKTVRELQIDL